MSEFAKAITVDAERPEITGQLRRKDRRPAPWDQDVSIPVWTLKGPNGGERSIHGVPAVLRRLMEQHEDDAMVGEDVTIRYAGTGQTSAGRDFVIHELDFREREAA